MTSCVVGRGNYPLKSTQTSLSVLFSVTSRPSPGAVREVPTPRDPTREVCLLGPKKRVKHSSAKFLVCRFPSKYLCY